MLRTAVVLALVALAAAQLPTKCSSPKQWEANMLIADARRGHTNFAVIAEYGYDETNQRKHIWEFANLGNRSEPLRGLIELHKEGVYYEWEENDRKSCKKGKLQHPFIPHSVVNNATFISDFILGTTAAAGAGVEIEIWNADFQTPRGKIHWYAHFTRVACVPVLVQTDFGQGETLMEQFVDVTLGLRNPNWFIPPAECP